MKGLAQVGRKASWHPKVVSLSTESGALWEALAGVLGLRNQTAEGPKALSMMDDED